jgi:hypothetical protein
MPLKPQDDPNLINAPGGVGYGALQGMHIDADGRVEPGVSTTPILESSTGADPSLQTDFHHLFTFPNATGISTVDNYADSSNPGTTIYQLAGGVYNSGVRNAVAVAGFARGLNVWGANLVVGADGAGAVASGMEIDFGIIAPNVGECVGLSLHSHFSRGNPAGYLAMLARYGSDTPAPRYGIQIALNRGTDQPLQSGGVIFEISGALETTYGLDFHQGAFLSTCLYIPVNPGSGSATKGAVFENRGGKVNTQAMVQLQSVDADSQSTHGLRFASAAGAKQPVIPTGRLIYVDGGTYAYALDLQAATFTSTNGAIAMGDNSIGFGTGTGGMIGTNPAQKLALWGKQPTVQPVLSGSRSDGGSTPIVDLLIDILATVGVLDDETTP